jgi:hypothetical protein
MTLSWTRLIIMLLSIMQLGHNAPQQNAQQNTTQLNDIYYCKNKQNSAQHSDTWRSDT